MLYVLIGLVITLPIATRGFYTKKNLPGVAFCLAIAIPIWLLDQWLNISGGAMFGIIIGMLLANFWRPAAVLKPGIQETSKRMLQSAVLLLGFGMDFGEALRLGSQTLALIVSVVVCVLLAAFLIGKWLKVPTDENILIGVGSAICGGSAIAAAAPVIKAPEKAVAGAISTIFLFNIVAVFLFPVIGNLTGMSEHFFGIWAGAAINDTSSVLAAADFYGGEAVEVAAVVKLTRALLIIPVVFGLAVIQSKKETGERSGFKLGKALPWFVVGFVAASVLNTANVAFGEIISLEITAFWGSVMSRFLIVMAMVGIGLSTNFKELIRHGKKPIILGFCCSVTVAVTAIVFMRVFGI